MRIVLVTTLLFLSVPATAQYTQRDGTVRRDGVVVPPSYQTLPNDSRLDNWSTRGNVNPFTGERGTVNPFAIPRPEPYRGLGAPDRNRW